MPEPNGFEIAILLFGCVWGAFGMVINIFSALNERRDLILGIVERKAPLSSRQMRTLLYNDWLPLWIGSFLFLAFITVMFCLLPHLLYKGQAHNYPDHIELACMLAAFLSGFGVCADLISGMLDIRAMRTVIKQNAQQRLPPRILKYSKHIAL